MRKKTTFTSIMIIFILLSGTNCELDTTKGNPIVLLGRNFFVHDNYYFSSPDYVVYLFGENDYISISNYSDYSNREKICNYELHNSTNVRGYFLNDNLLYLVVDMDDNHDQYFGIEIVDISNINSPEFICSFYIEGLLASNWYNIPLSNFETLQFLENYLFVSVEKFVNSSGIKIFDCSDPASPTEICYYPTLGYNSPFFAINGETMYVSYEETLDVVDISNITNPVLLSKIDLGFCAKLLIHNDFLCIGPNKNLPIKFYDITDSTNPIFITDFSEMQNRNFTDIAFVDDFAFFITTNYVSLFNITQINNPILVNDYDFTDLIDSIGDEYGVGFFYRGLIDNKRLYLGRISSIESLTVMILDFTNPTHFEIYGPNFDTATIGINLSFDTTIFCFLSVNLYVIAVFLRKELKKRRKLKIGAI